MPSSPSGATNEKAKRYDRQLRLWGDHGQHLLERARVCLVGGAGAVGCEVIKSLVLPGVGAFAIVDDKPITKEDVGNNFFLDMGETNKRQHHTTYVVPYIVFKGCIIINKACTLE